MDISWLGTAGFIIKNRDSEIVFDPFLSRGLGLQSPFNVQSFQNSRAIFVGHGHFDHIYDIPNIVAGTDVRVYSGGITAQILKMQGVPSDRIIPTHNKGILFPEFKVRAFRSNHVKFDWPLIWKTMKRCGVGGCLHIGGLGIRYPQGLVQTYLFEVDGRKILFMSSAGSLKSEINEYRNLEVDLLLAPLQGHTWIQKIMAQQIMAINPKMVIPHHHDDFYPPLSDNISAQLLEDELKFLGYKGDFLEIPLFKSIQL